MTLEELQKLRDMFESFKKSDSYEIAEARALFLDTLFDYAFLAGEKSGKEKAVEYALEVMGKYDGFSMASSRELIRVWLEKARIS